MALPEEYVSYNEYFTKALSFLNEHDYIFNFANTDILLNDILKNFASKWQERLKVVKNNEIIKLSEDEKKTKSSGCQISKQYEEFDENLRRLLPSMNSVKYYNDESSVKQKPLNGLSPKKQHEIFKLSELIHDHCKHKNITLIVDIGSGLGYLSQLMYEKYGYSVLGIESDEIRLSSALKRQEKYHKSSVKNVKYVRHFVTAQSDNALMELVEENFDKCVGFCLVGLHACADLAVNAIKLFLQIQECNSLIIMPCCYHKMTFIPDVTIKLNDSFDKCLNLTISAESIKSSDCRLLVDMTDRISKNVRLMTALKKPEGIEIKMSTDAADNNGFIFESFDQCLNQKKSVQSKKSSDKHLKVDMTDIISRTCLIDDCVKKPEEIEEIKISTDAADNNGFIFDSLNQCLNPKKSVQSKKSLDKHLKVDISDISRTCLINDCVKKPEEIKIKISTDAADNNGFIFENFPMSKALKTSYRKLNANILLRRPFLRLACQRVQAGWKESDDEGKDGARVFHLMSRAVLQLYALKENAKLVKIKRRAVRKIQSKKCDFESFLDDAINRGYILEILPDKELKSNFSEDFSSTSEMHQEYCVTNKATGNCTDSNIAQNKNDISQHGAEEEQLQKKEQRKTIQRQDISIGKRNEACSTFESLEMHKNKDALENKNYLEFDKCRIMALWNCLSSVDFDAAALLLELQDSLQGLCENLVLLDKIAFLHEHSEENIRLHFEFLKVTNDSLSPRCHALIAEK